MVRFLQILFQTSLLISIIGCSGSSNKELPKAARQVLEGPGELELLSLEPNAGEKEKHEFHKWKVLGKTTVEDSAIRDLLIFALKKGVEENEGRAASCFYPRHGIRITDGDEVHDFVICFQCSQIIWYIDGNQAGHFYTTDSPKSAFNPVLEDAKVPLANKSAN